MKKKTEKKNLCPAILVQLVGGGRHWMEGGGETAEVSRQAAFPSGLNVGKQSGFIGRNITCAQEVIELPVACTEPLGFGGFTGFLAFLIIKALCSAAENAL